MTYRIATVSFLNAWPLVKRLPAGDGSVTLLSDLPSRLPELLHAGRADAAIIPVVEYFRGAGAAVVPGVAIAADGPAASVKLFSRVPPAAIRHVAVDRGSRTSVALLRILFAELYDVQPDFRIFTPDPADVPGEADAALVIGDRCFAAEGRLRLAGRDDVYIVDLAEVWREMTGLPFVFAVWAVGRSFAATADAAARRELERLLMAARDAGLRDLDALAAEAAAAGLAGPGGEVSAPAIAAYFRDHLRYTLGERELAGLRLFHALCVRHAVCPPGRPVEVAARSRGE